MEQYNVGGKEFSPEEVIIQAKKAAGWLGAITIFSIINLVLMSVKANVTFVIGLGITQIITALTLAFSEGADPVVAKIIFIIGLVINISIIGIYALLWWLAKRGSIAAYIVGMVLYVLDGFIFLLAQDWIGVGFHVFFLFMLIGGYSFMKKRKEIDRMVIEQEEGIIDVDPLPQENEENILEERAAE